MLLESTFVGLLSARTSPDAAIKKKSNIKGNMISLVWFDTQSKRSSRQTDCRIV